MQAMVILLTDRTVLDQSTVLSGVVNAEKRKKLKAGLRLCADDVLAMDAPGEDLLNRALQSVCSYQIRDDVVLIGQVQAADLVKDRSSRVDYALLEKALKLARTIGAGRPGDRQ